MKKFLSLVLALVMTMSLVTVGAGAKDFTDNSKIAYKEAVDVMSAIKVIDGYSDGAFNPANTLTRGAAAKIICNLILGPTTAVALGADTAPFKDVPASNTFAGYIAYCAQQGIINGYADGTFRPAGTVTGYQFMKMLLVALGYAGKSEGFTGANWSVNVAKIALSIGLNKGNDKFNGTAAMTREEACLYAFNALKAVMVEYDSTTNIVISGTPVSVGGSKAKDMANSADKETIKDDNKMQFAEKYFSNLKKTGGSDDFGRPATTWKVKAEKIGTYANAADASYTKEVKTGDIYSDLGLSEKIVAGKVTVYTDGEAKANAMVISKGNDTDKFGGNGVLTEVFYDDTDNSAVVTMVNTYVGTISKTVAATASKDAYVVVALENGLGSKEFTTTAEFKDDAYVLATYSVSAKAVKSLAVAESVEGTATKVVTGKNNALTSIEMGGTTYKASAMVAGVPDPAVKSDYIVYMDSYGYAIFVEETKFVSTDYALVLSIQGSNSGFNTDRVKLLTAEGTVKIYDTDKNYTTKVAEDDIVTYKLDDAKIATLKVAQKGGNNHSTSVKNDFSLVKGTALVKFADSVTAYANSKTLFVVKTAGDVYKTYTGVNSVPTIEVKGSSAIESWYYCKNTGMITVAFIDASNATVTSSSKDVIYLATASASKKTTDADGSYYTYNAVINGEITTVKAEKKVSENTLRPGAIYDNKNIITDYVAAGTENTDWGKALFGTVKQSGDYTIGFYGEKAQNSVTRLTVAEKANIYLVDPDGAIIKGTLRDVKTDVNDTALYTLKDGQITNLFVQEVKGDAIVDPGKPNVDTNNYNVTVGAGNAITVKYYYTGVNSDDNAILDQIEATLTADGYTNFKAVYDTTTSLWNITATKGSNTRTFSWDPTVQDATHSGKIACYKVSVDGKAMLVAKFKTNGSDASTLSDIGLTLAGTHAIVTDKAGTVGNATVYASITVADGSAYDTGYMVIASAGSVTVTGSTNSVTAATAKADKEFAKAGEKVTVTVKTTANASATKGCTVEVTPTGTGATVSGPQTMTKEEAVAGKTLTFTITVGTATVSVIATTIVDA